MNKKYFSFGNTEGLPEQQVALQPQWGKPTIKVKFMHRGLRRGGSPAGFFRQFPGLFPQWGSCLFDFDVDCRDYDWLVVYQDIPRDSGYFSEEKLACPKEKTLLLTGEPSSITVFGTDYLRQFGCILTFQEPWAMKHPNVIFHHPGLMWYYGLPYNNDGKFITWDMLAQTPPPVKTRMLSTVCSTRTGNITLHSARVLFTRRLQEDLPELEVFGHGVRPMNDKREALDAYRFHIVIENHVYPHHLTEKLPDVYLGYTLPFYHGAPNAAEYFPKESFIAIDINDYKRSLDIIKSHLNAKEYVDRLPAIIEARRRVLEEQNLFAIVSRIITQEDKKVTTATMGKVIRNRSTLRMKNPFVGIRSLTEKATTKIYHRLTYNARNKKKNL